MKALLLRGIILSIFLLAVSTVNGQYCYATLSKNEVDLNGQSSAYVTATYAGDCGYPILAVDPNTIPSWVTVSTISNTIKVTPDPLPSSVDYREAWLIVTINGSTSGGFKIFQGVEAPPPPPPPCYVTGFSGLSFSELGQSQTLDLVYSDCSSTGSFIFRTDTGGYLPNWIQITQPTSSTIKVEVDQNNTAATRGVTVIGTANLAGKQIQIYGSFSQASCVPPKPSIPIMKSQVCGSTVLEQVDAPASNNITWYWQEDSTGTSTSNSNTSITKTSGTVLYLRAKNAITGCWSDAVSVSYNVKKIPSAATVSGNYRCGGSGTVTISASPGTNGNTIRWYSAFSGGTLLHTGTSYTTPSISSTKTYYASSYNTSTGCESNTRRAVVATIYQVLNSGSLSTQSPLCYNTSPGTLSGSGASGGKTPYNYQWQVSSNGSSGWSNISGATSSNYAPGNLTSTRWYRRAVSSCNETKYTSALKVAVYPTLNGGSIGGNKTICSGMNAGNLNSASSPSGGNGSYSYQWQYSTNGTSGWSAISGATASTYSPGNLTSTRWFRRKVTSCNGTQYSNTVKVTITPQPIWYADSDGDGYGDFSTTQSACNKPAGYVANDDDYDDTTNLITNIAPRYFYKDTDGDGFGDPNDSVYRSVQPSDYVTNNTDQCPNIASSNSNGCPYDDVVLSNENYIYTRTYQRAMTSEAGITQNSDVIEQVTYFDGLGRPMQEVAIKASPTGQKDIVRHIGYDAFGRQDKDWLPYLATGSIGSYRSTDPAGATQTYYEDNYTDDVIQGASNPYAQKQFEASPLNRVLKQAAPGEDWKLGNGHEITFAYDANTGTEVKLFTVTTSADTFTDSNGNKTTTYRPDLNISAVNNGYYQAGELYKTITYDENHTLGKLHSTEEFTDKQGQVILKRTYGPSDVDMDGSISTNEQTVTHDTYYVYDDYGNLTYVLPPKMNATTASLSTINLNLDALGYQYTYDGRNRLVEKQVAGKEVEYIVYNKLDQPILTQDVNQRINSEWLFTLYDAFGRIAYTGKDTNNHKSREELQILADAHDQQFVTQTGIATTYSGTPVYYTKDAFPDSFDQVMTIHYYDSYVDTDGLSIPSQIYGVPKATGIGTQGLSTVNKIRVLGTDQWITTITGYDKKGRVIYSGEQNDYLNTTTIIQNDLDFVGKVEESKTQHRKGTGTWIVTVDKYNYDHSGRLADHYQCIGEGSSFSGCDDSADGESFTLTEAPTETWNKTASTSITLKPGFHFIASSGKSFHGSIAEKGELIAENTYDDLGQLISKGVGNTTVQPLQTIRYAYNIRGWLKKINDPSNLGTNLFGFEIKYNDITDPTKKLYNGNISQTLWNSKSVNPNPPNNLVSNQYTYSYDALNRITEAVDNTANYNVTGITYDQNGNIMRLLRKGHTNESATTFGNMDNLIYGYDSGNKLLSVIDAVTTPTLMKGEFKDGNKTGNDYDYDDNGNLTQDLNKGIAANGITYNHLNLPSSITTTTGNISYIYDASGTKLQKTVTEGSSVTSITDYSGNYIYENGDLQFFSHPEGYVNAEGSGYKYVYQYNDHLGNVRLSYSDADLSGSINPATEIINEKNYYPFGLLQKGYNNVVNGVEHPYDFQGKENEKELDLNWHDFHARRYMADIGRTTTQDPLAEDFYGISPYSFLNNSPPNFIDPTGMSAESPDNEYRFVWNEETEQYDQKQVSNLGGNDFDVVHYEGGEKDGNIDVAFNPATETPYTPEYGGMVGERTAPGEWDTHWRGASGAATPGFYAELLPLPKLAFGKYLGKLLGWGGKKATQDAVEIGGHMVYQAIDKSTGAVRYVGITSRGLAVRAAEHKAADATKAGLKFIEMRGMQNLSKTQARIFEQRLINQYGLQKNGGLLLNKINSIAPKYWKQHGIKP